MSLTNKLRVTVVQCDLHWKNPSANHQSIENLLGPVKTDLIVLPEMFNTGFSMDSERLAEPHLGLSFQWMQSLSKKLECDVVGSIITSDQGHYYNRLYWVKPDGSFHQYDKRHLFRMADEHHYFTEGTQKLQVSLNGWKISPFICYDLRFPVWSRNTESSDLYLYIANWPAARSSAWTNLLEARAHENQCYVVGVNRVGTDGKDIAYTGDTRVFGPKGEPLVKCAPGQVDIQTTTLCLNDLNDYRTKFPAFKDADDFKFYVQ